MNIYVFERITQSVLRGLWIEEHDGHKSVVDIFEMAHDQTKESLKHTVRCLYEMMFVGTQPDDKDGYEIKVASAGKFKDYDAALEGKARKQSSKEINVITELLWNSVEM